MPYTALYNKYRPQTFDEVAGQQVIVKTLRNAIAMNKIAHAYLFCGPRGTGKTTMARLFAKALNCDEGLGHQCNHCDNCVALNQGSHPDVMEIDGASNNGVEQVRSLIERVNYAPMKGRYKVYIIDEVHMMSAGAFNALLKTLEEPPEHVIFILATTEPYKVLPTIVSRCQRYDFGKIDPADMKKKLVEILGKEKIEYEDAALDEIIDLSEGGMRDALSILDQVLAFGGEKLREKDVLSVFGLASTQEKVDFLKLVAQGKVSETLAKLDAFIDGGIDVRRLVSNFLDDLKDALIYKKTKDISLCSTLNEAQAKELSSLLDYSQINQSIDILLKAQADFKIVSNVRSLFELTALQLCSLHDATPVAAQPAAQPKQAAPMKPAAAPTPAPQQAPAPQPALSPAPKVETPVPQPAPAPKKQSYDPDSGKPYLGSEAPAFLFEDEQKPKENAPTPAPKPAAPAPAPKPAEPVKPIEVPVSAKSLVISGGSYSLDDDTLIQIMVLGGKFKEARKNLHSQWGQFQSMRLDPKYGDAADLLAQAQPFCLCQEALLINFNFTRLKDRANIIENQKILAKLVEKVLGRKVFVYGFDRTDVNRIYTLFTNLQQINKLPKADDIQLKLPK